MNRKLHPCLPAGPRRPLPRRDHQNYGRPVNDAAVQAPVRAGATAAGTLIPNGWGCVDDRVPGHPGPLETRYRIKGPARLQPGHEGLRRPLTDAQLALLKADPSVMAIEEDKPVYARPSPGASPPPAPPSSTLAGNGSGAVSGVNVYVIDTGIARPTRTSTSTPTSPATARTPTATATAPTWPAPSVPSDDSARWSAWRLASR